MKKPTNPCAEAVRRLDDYTDRELGPEELREVQQHLDMCAGCSEHFAGEREVLETLRSKLRRIAAPPQLLERVRNALGPP